MFGPHTLLHPGACEFVCRLRPAATPYRACLPPAARQPKATHSLTDLPIPRPANWFLFSPGVVAACRKSLARLGVDKIDLYQVSVDLSASQYR